MKALKTIRDGIVVTYFFRTDQEAMDFCVAHSKPTDPNRMVFLPKSVNADGAGGVLW